MSSMLPTPPVLRLSGISKRFPGVVALDGVSLDLRAGCVLGLVGENGAGAYMLTVLARSGYDEFRDCGEQIHDPGEGGPMYVDAGPGGAGGDAGIDVGRTGFACLCTTGGARPSGGELVLFALVAGFLAVRRRRAR